LNNVVASTHQKPLWRWWPAGALLLLLAGGGLALTSIEPRYQVLLGDQTVASGRNLPRLAAGLRATWADHQARTMTLTAGDQRWTYTLAELGLPDGDSLIGLLHDQAASIPWWERLATSRPTIAVEPPPGWLTERLEAALAPIRAAVEKEPIPATFAIDNQTPIVTPETNGVQIETGQVLQALLAALGAQPHGSPNPAAELALPLTPKVPDVTRASLEAMRLKGVVAEWTTYYDPSIPRADNVERAARAFNGLLLKPGEMLSYNATVGPVDYENGWKEAFVIVNGELVPGIGGGVCQVATTFYGAALRANLEILERHQHQLAVAYIDPSQDAAIAQGWEDLKIRNTTLGHLYIETESGGGSVTFRLYGEVPAGQTVKIESEVLGSVPFETRRIPDPNLAPGKQVVRSNGSRGLRSQAFRSVFMNGELVKRERLSQDYYLPTAHVIAEGPAPKTAAEPPATPDPANNG
jgi:vancomycin resistance protein YoaR